MVKKKGGGSGLNPTRWHLEILTCPSQYNCETIIYNWMKCKLQFITKMFMINNIRRANIFTVLVLYSYSHVQRTLPSEAVSLIPFIKNFHTKLKEHFNEFKNTSAFRP